MKLIKMPLNDWDSHPPYNYQIYDHCIDVYVLRKWVNESKLDGEIYSNVAYFMSEKDAMWFMLRWSS